MQKLLGNNAMSKENQRRLCTKLALDSSVSYAFQKSYLMVTENLGWGLWSNSGSIIKRLNANCKLISIDNRLIIHTFQNHSYDLAAKLPNAHYWSLPKSECKCCSSHNSQWRLPNKDNFIPQSGILSHHSMINLFTIVENHDKNLWQFRELCT